MAKLSVVDKTIRFWSKVGGVLGEDRIIDAAKLLAKEYKLKSCYDLDSPGVFEICEVYRGECEACPLSSVLYSSADSLCAQSAYLEFMLQEAAIRLKEGKPLRVEHRALKKKVDRLVAIYTKNKQKIEDAISSYEEKAKKRKIK